MTDGYFAGFGFTGGYWRHESPTRAADWFRPASARERGAADEGFGAGHGRYHRAAQGHHLPNRCEAFARRDQGANPTGQEARRSAIEAVIGHMKAEGHLGRCYLKGRAGDAANVILSAVGYNLRLVLAWLRIILRVILLALLQTFTIRPALKPAS